MRTLIERAGEMPGAPETAVGDATDLDHFFHAIDSLVPDPVESSRNLAAMPLEYLRQRRARLDGYVAAVAPAGAPAHRRCLEHDWRVAVRSEVVGGRQPGIAAAYNGDISLDVFRKGGKGVERTRRRRPEGTYGRRFRHSLRPGPAPAPGQDAWRGRHGRRRLPLARATHRLA